MNYSENRGENERIMMMIRMRLMKTKATDFRHRNWNE